MGDPRTGSGRPVTIVDIARAAGVSKSTVSLVLKGSSLVKAETRQSGRAGHPAVRLRL